MSKLSFRARQVDYTKGLPIYLNHDLPDLQDFAAINRAVPQMPTGMEKDEEAEHHLQRALSALQAFGDKSSNDYSIPTPKVEIDNKMYDRIYNIECPKQKQYIRIQPFSNDCEYPDYDADYEDEIWLTEMKQKLPVDFTDDLTLYFETVMDRLEKATAYSTNLMSLGESKMILMRDTNGNDENELINTNTKYQKELEEFLIAIYEYWKKKRTKAKHPLTPIVMTDKSGIVSAPNNPYLVFRRRIEKMQTRKNRKNEEQSYEKMLILKRDLCRAQQILKLIKKRESFKKEFLKLTLETFEKRYKLNDYDGAVTDQIMCMLKPSSMQATQPTHSTNINAQQGNNNANTNFTNNTHLLNLNTENQVRKLGQNNNHYNNHHKSEKNSLSSIDKTIVNLINSNKLKTSGSPPHSSLKKAPHIESDFLADSMFDTKQRQLQHDKSRRQKKEKRIRESDSNTNTISNLIDHKKIFGNLIDLSNKNKLSSQLHHSLHQKQQQQPNGSNNNKQTNINHNKNHQTITNPSPLLNRSTNKQDLLQKKTHKIINNMEMEQMQFNRMVNSQRRRNNSVSSRQSINATNGSINSQFLAAESSQDTYNSHTTTGDSNNNKKMVGPDLSVFNEQRDYEEELRANQIENIDSILSETKSRLSTSSDKDGYWYFKRKEGCKYLPQSGPIFKNDVLEEPTFIVNNKHPLPLIPEATTSSTLSSMDPPPSTSTNHTHALLHLNNTQRKSKKLKRKDRLHELQHFYYGYAVNKRQRHLGLVRRRAGRGGRIILDRFNGELGDSISECDVTRTSKDSSHGQPFQFDFTKFKTYYPYECFDLNEPNPSEITDISSTSQFQSTALPTTTNNHLATISNEKNPRKKLKLKNTLFDDNDNTNSDTDEYSPSPNTDTFYDHTLFTQQLETKPNDVNTNSQFLDETTRANLTTPHIDEETIKSFINTQMSSNKPRVPNQTVNDVQTLLTNPLTNYEFLGTDLDFDNLFEPDEDTMLVDNTTNVIKVCANSGPMNCEYQASSDRDYLNLSLARSAIKNLKVRPVVKKLADKNVGLGETVLIPSPKAELNNCTTSTKNTLIAPPSLSVATLLPAAPIITSSSSTTHTGLNKISILASGNSAGIGGGSVGDVIGSSSSGSGNRFHSLNKLGLNCSATQFQFRPLSPASNKPQMPTNEITHLTPTLNGNSYLVKKQQQATTIIKPSAGDHSPSLQHYSTTTSCSSSPSSSMMSHSNSVNNSAGSNISNGQSQHSQSVIVNGLLSKKKDDKTPFYPLYHHQSNTTSEDSQTKTKLLQAIHFNHSNHRATSSSTPSSSNPTSSSNNNHYLQNHIYNHSQHHQKSNGSSSLTVVQNNNNNNNNNNPIISNSPTIIASNEHTNTTKLLKYVSQ